MAANRKPLPTLFMEVMNVSDVDQKEELLENGYFSRANEKADQFGRVRSLVSSVSGSWGLH